MGHNSKQRRARKRLLEQSIVTQTGSSTPPSVIPPTGTAPPEVLIIPEAPPLEGSSFSSNHRYVGWVQNSNGEWVGQIGPQPRSPYRTIKLKTAKNVGLHDPTTGARYANVDSYARWHLEAQEAGLPDLLPINNVQQRVDRICRLSASLVANTKISVSKLSTVKWGKKFYLPGTMFVIDLTAMLDELAAGRARTWEHARANTIHGNRERILENTNQQGYDPVYLEFGWLYPVPSALIGTKRFDRGRYQTSFYRGRSQQRWVPFIVDEKCIAFKPDPLKPAPSSQNLLDDQLALTRIIVNQGGCVDVGLRLIISDSGDVYFTADHYETFYRYSEEAIRDEDEAGSWVLYSSPEFRRQLQRHTFMTPDASWYWPDNSMQRGRVWSLRNW